MASYFVPLVENNERPDQSMSSEPCLYVKVFVQDEGFGRLPCLHRGVLLCNVRLLLKAYPFMDKHKFFKGGFTGSPVKGTLFFL